MKFFTNFFSLLALLLFAGCVTAQVKINSSVGEGAAHITENLTVNTISVHYTGRYSALLLKIDNARTFSVKSGSSVTGQMDKIESCREDACQGRLFYKDTKGWISIGVVTGAARYILKDNPKGNPLFILE